MRAIAPKSRDGTRSSGTCEGGDVFGWFRKRRSRPDGEDTVWVCEPTRTDLPLARRWGTLNDTGVSCVQFNVYRACDHFIVTRHMIDGAEIEDDGVFRGGQCATITEAYRKMVSYLSDFQILGGLAKFSQMTTIVETTPGLEPTQVGTIEFREVRRTADYPMGGAVWVTECSDPETRQPLASTPPSFSANEHQRVAEYVPVSEMAQLDENRRHNAKLLSKVLDAAVFRMASCPLATEVVSEFAEDSANFDAAKSRYVVFTSWCARHAVFCLSETNDDAPMILAMMDALIQDQTKQMFLEDRTAIDAAVQAFQRFDQGLADDESHANEPDMTEGWCLGNIAADFIFGAVFEQFTPDQTNPEQWARRCALPSNVYLDIYGDAKSILVDLRPPSLRYSAPPRAPSQEM